MPSCTIPFSCVFYDERTAGRRYGGPYDKRCPLQQCLYGFGDFFGDIRVIHGVDVDAVYAVGQEIGNLVDGVGDADIAHGFGSVTVFGNGPLEFDGERGATQGDHAFDLSFVGDGHEAGFDGNIDTGDFLSFADYFFDGFVVDWMVQDRINTARRQVDEAIRRTEYIVNQLQRM